MRKTVLWLCLAALMLGAVAVLAQEMHQPPKVLMLIREEVKPGKMAAHNLNETAWVQGFKKAKYDTPGLGLTSVTGNAEVLFLTGYDSFAALETDGEKMEKNAALRQVNETYGPKEADLVSESRTMVMRYRSDLSYQPNVNIGEYKYFNINVIRFRMGEDVAAFYKALNGARQKAGSDAHVAMYQVSSGAASGTYLAFSPVKSLAEWDTPPNEAMSSALKEINWSQMVGKTIMGSESRLYAISPQLSIPSASMIAANPSFWNPKPMMAKKAAPGAGAAEKPTPAAKKETKTEKK